MDLCDAGTLRSLCARYGFTFSKEKGQHFLIDRAVLDRIVSAAAPDAHTAVLEAGPGFGTLTAALAESAGAVVAVELDRRALPVLAETLAAHGNVTVLPGDILTADIEAPLRRTGLPRRIAVANLPYQVTTKAVLRLLQSGLFSALTLMMQWEVAQKLLAQPGDAAWCLFSAAARYYAEITRVLRVPRTAFYPQPHVDSAVLQFAWKEPAAPPEDERAFLALARAAFAARRKTLRNNLRGLYPEDALDAAFAQCALPADVRGEMLTPEQLDRLAKQLPPPCGA